MHAFISLLNQYKCGLLLGYSQYFKMTHRFNEADISTLDNLLKDIASFEEYANTEFQYSQIDHAAKLRGFYSLFHSSAQSEPANSMSIEKEMIIGGHHIQISCSPALREERHHEHRQQLSQFASLLEDSLNIEKKKLNEQQGIDLSLDGCVEYALKNFRYRHPQLLDHIELYNFEKFNQLLKERESNSKIITLILKDVVRNLYIYKGYFTENSTKYRQMANFLELRQKVKGEISYLQKVYEFQQQNIRQLFGPDIREIVSGLIPLKLYPNLRKLYKKEKNLNRILKKIEQNEQKQQDISSLSSSLSISSSNQSQSIKQQEEDHYEL